jgi:disease resistance protein RPS2
MAGTIATIGVVTGAVGATTRVVQAVSHAKQGFWDPPNVTLLDSLEEIHGALLDAVQVLGSVRKDFENEVEKNKMRVPSTTYVEWIRRVLEIDGQVKDLMAEYDKESKEETSWWLSPCPGFREEMKKMHEKVINLVRESYDIRDKILVVQALEPVVKKKGPDISKFGTLQKPLEKILDWLKSSKVKGICIHGIVGSGKTTVMLNLNNHDQVGKMFDIVIWLTISEKQSNKNQSREHLQRAIAQRLNLTVQGTSSTDEVAQRIRTELKGKKYLLLLDDVKESLDTDEIGIPTNNGSKIVLTTRLPHVCKSNMDKVIKVSCLSPDEAWEMFLDILGSKRLIDDGRIGSIAFQVCSECCGLPLLIERVANIFNLQGVEIIWQYGLNSWRMWPWQESEGIREVYELLRFCYNDLVDDRYKNCFPYGALYAEDTEWLQELCIFR